MLCAGFSSCGQCGLLCSCGVWVLHCTDFFCWGARTLGCTGFTSRGSWAHYLQHMGLADLWYVNYFWTRGQTQIPCIGRLILNHQTTREVHLLRVLIFLFLDTLGNLSENYTHFPVVKFSMLNNTSSKSTLNPSEKVRHILILIQVIFWYLKY